MLGQQEEQPEALQVASDAGGFLAVLAVDAEVIAYDGPRRRALPVTLRGGWSPVAVEV